MRLRFCILLSLCLGFLTGTGAAGQKLLRFDKPVQTVGSVRYDGGEIRLDYAFENLSDKDVTVLEIRSSCGCFTGSFTPGPVASGKKGLIRASFKPETLYGEQDRHLTVVASDGDRIVLSSLTLTGYVERDETEGEIRYLTDLGGGLRTELPVYRASFDRFGDCAFLFPLYNDTDRPMRLSVYAPAPVRIYYPDSIPPRSRVDLRGVVALDFFWTGEWTLPLRLFVDGRPAGAVSIRANQQ